MKTTDPRDPLDRKIDALLREQPIRASEDFLGKTLGAIDAAPSKQPKRGATRWIRFALPAAAAIALAFVLVPQFSDPAPQSQPVATTDTPESTADPLTSAEMQELFRLQEGLSGLAAVDESALEEEDLVQDLDTLLGFFES